ncbi:AraC family transcriptional regulator [Pseudovibrio japonicus]|uniref:AraC family transcriptional regulator n=1 Tax=Pseudovibrio japonicus TaxID=366534 RepID=A0ABQ3EM09_9HYPH|nr:AraC family transcriptional regulator [Pseudovibrio japonicus]GHB41241.1 AraC family transcriptional regulator [Pseudovibrio japonicus]
MKAGQSKAAYEKRMLRVLEYIYDNLDGDLSLDTLADVACMSRFHWHRVFQSMRGETLATAIRRIRLNRAALDLLQSDAAVTEIAERYGYPSAQSFSRAFKGEYGVAPGQFRENKSTTPALASARNDVFTMHPVEIREMPERYLQALSHRGSYGNMGAIFSKLAAMLSSRGVIRNCGPFIGIYYDDPAIVPEDELRSYAGAVVPNSLENTSGLEPLVIPACRCAVLRHQGAYAGLQAAFSYLYGVWLPSSGEEAADQPCYEIFLNSLTNTSTEDLLVEICLPLQ